MSALSPTRTHRRTLEIPIRTLRREIGIFLCHWGILIGFRCAQIVNLPVLITLWGTLLFCAWGIDAVGHRFRFTDLAKPREMSVLKTALPFSGLLALSVALALLATRFRDSLFPFLDRALTIIQRTNTLSNWVLFATFLAGVNLLGRVASRARLADPRYVRLLPFALLVALFLKNWARSTW